MIKHKTLGFVFRQTHTTCRNEFRTSKTCTDKHSYCLLSSSSTKQSRRPLHISRRYEQGHWEDQDSDHDYGDGGDEYGGGSNEF